MTNEGSAAFQPIEVLGVDRQTAEIYAEGWQSWSPTRVYRLSVQPMIPQGSNVVVMGYRGDQPPATGYQGEGLLAVAPAADAPVVVYSDAAGLASIRAVPVTGPGGDSQAPVRALRIEATGPVTRTTWPGGLASALGGWGSGLAAQLGVNVRGAPTAWCSWYHYFTAVTQQDMDENLQAIDDLDLPVEVIQVDDGYQAEIGDWLTLSDRFRSLPGLVSRIKSHGRRAGIWVAPFLVGARSRLRAEHPDWLVGGASAGRNWDQELFVLDVTNPRAGAHLSEVFATLRDFGFDYFKIDFCYAGAQRGQRHEQFDGPVPEVSAYRHGLALIREAIGAQAFLLGCGAPILPSVGLVDAMRVSPDVAVHYEATDGDPSQPGTRSAIGNGLARAWQHGRFWVNDPDCIIARPQVERREEWAAHVAAVGGLRASSDRLRSLDDWGLATTRALLTNVPPPTPFPGS